MFRSLGNFLQSVPGGLGDREDTLSIAQEILISLL